MAAASALALGTSLLAACAAGQSAHGGCTAPAGAAGAAGAAAPTGAGTAATGRKGPLKLTGDQAPPKGGGADNAALPRSGTVTLVTGDRVRLDVAPDGRQTVTLADAKAARDGSGGLLRFDWAGEQFAVPYAAVPFLGSTLDPRLFDVSYLVRAGLDDEHSSTLPVTIQPSGSGKADELPGVRMAKGERAASATIDKSKARGLGRLLMKRWKESRGAGAAAKPLPVARIGLAATKGTPPPPEPPRAPAAAESGKGKHYRTLGLDFTGPDGKPATALGWVQNISDPTVGPFIVASPTPDAKPVTGEGPFRISVPDGTYSIAFTILTPHSGTYLGADGALVVEPELTVKGDRNITLDARTTKPYRMNLEPEVTGDLRIDSMTFVRTGVDGSGCAGYPIAMDLLSAQGSGLAASTLSASPTRKVTKGTLGFNAISGIALDSPSGKHAKPRYYLTFSHEGAVPPSLTYSVPESKLTTVHTRTYGQASGEVCEGSERRDLTPYVYTSGRSLKFGYSADVQLGEHTDYWYSNAPDRVLWSTSHLNAQCLRSYDSFRHIKPGERIEQEWGKAPVAPGQAGIIGTHFGLPMPGAGPAALCPACRAGRGGDAPPGPLRRLRPPPFRRLSGLQGRGDRGGVLLLPQRDAHGDQRGSGGWRGLATPPDPAAAAAGRRVPAGLEVQPGRATRRPRSTPTGRSGPVPTTRPPSCPSPCAAPRTRGARARSCHCCSSAMTWPWTTAPGRRRAARTRSRSRWRTSRALPRPRA
ncbi:hypothetical protein LUX57_22105 [Actinomadura madurae]|uniref:hypothetical protein n=1 Tax=Actinomadura madurae TaxID=1993 RepID=UPI0020D20A7B|nr:hypothetical protein [Actinomadura madurae]MCP9967483.1 hypothetical protein [Actinomadura madurae]